MFYALSLKLISYFFKSGILQILSESCTWHFLLVRSLLALSWALETCLDVWFSHNNVLRTVLCLSGPFELFINPSPCEILWIPVPHNSDSRDPYIFVSVETLPALFEDHERSWFSGRACYACFSGLFRRITGTKKLYTDFEVPDMPAGAKRSSKGMQPVSMVRFRARGLFSVYSIFQTFPIIIPSKIHYVMWICRIKACTAHGTAISLPEVSSVQPV